nr:PREDICTED: ras-related protein Rap-2a-like [Struthio camelus australis]
MELKLVCHSGSKLAYLNCVIVPKDILYNLTLKVVIGRIWIMRFEKVPVILVGNKVDLESEREVSSNEGRALAEEWGCPFMETSAKSKTMVDELFAEIVRQMNYAAQPDKDDPCCSACNIQ